MTYFSMALYTSLKLSLLTAIILIMIAYPVAYWLSNMKNRLLKNILITTITMPLILPPTVLGFYFLILFQKINDLTTVNLAFTFNGLLLASIIYSLPFAVQPLYLSLSEINPELEKVAQTLGATPWQSLRKVVLPLSKKGAISGFIFSFAHTVGEFGVVLMIGGSIPGQTKVLATSIYEEVEKMNYDNVYSISAFLLIISFIILFVINNFKPYDRK